MFLHMHWESESKREAISTFPPKQLDRRGEEVKVEVRHTSTLLPDVAVQDTHCEGGWQQARAKRRILPVTDVTLPVWM